ncbi:MAG: prolyl oligopeptidase family serine peptidase [Verrucomicrobiales bacterium]|jgi:predicted peptidase|nr:prolyl oligopeptidase family serine peptidase [Verrucomicrobiales bacterium]
MKLLLAWVAVLQGLVLPFSASAATLPANQEAKRFEKVLPRTLSQPYLLFLPKGYEATGTKRWPLMIFLHGAGERGTNLAAVAVHGPPKMVTTNPDFPFVLVSPQCPEGATWDVTTLDALLTEILATHAIDPARVCLTGLSMGGYGSWAWALAHPQRFAAVAPICGGGSTIDALLASGARRDHLKRLPVWAFHGGKDNVVPLSESERMIDAFKKLGNTPRLTVYPEAGHDSWSAAYRDPALLAWFLEQKRP